MDKSVWFDLARRAASAIAEGEFRSTSYPRWRVDKTALVAGLLRSASTLADDYSSRSSSGSSLALRSDDSLLPDRLNRGVMVRVVREDDNSSSGPGAFRNAADKGEETLAALAWIGILTAFIYRFFVNDRNRANVRRRLNDLSYQWQQRS